jgi:zinc protease
MSVSAKRILNSLEFLTLSAILLALASPLACRAATLKARASAPESKDILRATLPNGLRVVIVRDPLAPVVTAVMNYEAGSDVAPAGFPGTAHAEEHMMFRGNPGLSADQLAEITAAMGGNFNADTQFTVTQYFFTVPAEDLDVALHIEAVRMSGIDDTQALWDKERGAIEQEVAQDLSNPFYVFYSKVLSTMFEGTAYDHDALGTRPSFDKTTAEMLQNFYQSWYAPNNAVYVIAGNVDPQAVLGEVKHLFSAIPEKKLPERPSISLGPVKTTTMNLNTDFPFGVAAITYRMPGSDSPDYAASQVLSDVLSSQRSNLYALVPQGKALFAQFSSLATLPQAGLAFAIAGYPKGGDGNALVQQMRQILADYVQKGFPADLVEASKRHELADAEFQRNSIEGLAFEWSNALAVEHRQSPDDDVEAMQKVTVDDVNRVARQYLAPENSIVAVLTPEESGKPISQNSFGGQESFAPSEVKAVALPEWASRAVNRLSIPASTAHPTVFNLPNGVTLIAEQESISNTVSVYGSIKNNTGLQQPKGQEGVASVLGALFSYGTTSLDRLQYQKALDDIGAHESAGTSFSLSVLPQNFDAGVRLLADNELHPGLPAEAFAIEKTKTARSVAGQLQSPGFLAGQALNKALFPPEDPSLRHATPESVSSLTLDDVKNYYQSVYRPDLTTIVVIGNISPEEAHAEILKYFGSWTATGPKPQTDLPEVPENKPSSAVVPDKSRVQDQVTLGETLSLNRFNPDYYALELGNHVLGGGFYATRLYRDLRENGGLVYFVASNFNVGRTRSTYTVAYACDPPNVSKARDIVVKDLTAISTAPVTPEELQQAKALLLREIPLSEDDVDSIAGGWLSRSAIGLPLDEPERAAERYMKLDAKDVEAAFAKWLRPNDLVEITQGPNPQ